MTLSLFTSWSKDIQEVLIRRAPLIKLSLPCRTCSPRQVVSYTHPSISTMYLAGVAPPQEQSRGVGVDPLVVEERCWSQANLTSNLSAARNDQLQTALPLAAPTLSSCLRLSSSQRHSLLSPIPVKGPTTHLLQQIFFLGSLRSMYIL